MHIRKTDQAHSIFLLFTSSWKIHLAKQRVPSVTLPNLIHIAVTQLSVSVSVDLDISDSPGFTAILRNKVARGASEHEGLAVVGVGNVHDQGGVEIVMLGNSAAFGLLAFHG
jgi:hypothetical protein